nr:LytTR family DNA-binding domain-containing protein [Aequitasia blattaphilus]
MLKLKDSFLFAQRGEKNYRIYLKNIYYFEAVEKKVFVYTKEHIYEVKDKLYQIEEKYESLDFLRVSKSVIVNINKIEAIYPALSGRFEVELYNGERLWISRSYVMDIKAKLGLER